MKSRKFIYKSTTNYNPMSEDFQFVTTLPAEYAETGLAGKAN